MEHSTAIKEKKRKEKEKKEKKEKKEWSVILNYCNGMYMLFKFVFLLLVYLFKRKAGGTVSRMCLIKV